MNVEIRMATGKPRETRVLVDGTDITRHVAAEEFNVILDPLEPRVFLTLMPDVLTLDLDDPIVSAIQMLHPGLEATTEEESA